jgi:DNA-directed RNA polymerase specialized sigma24 family protein
MEAEEIMHDTLLKYFDREDFDTIRERNAWLKRVCINLSIDRLRKRKVEEGIFKSDELKNPVIENEYADNYIFLVICISLLPLLSPILSQKLKA